MKEAFRNLTWGDMWWFLLLIAIVIGSTHCIILSSLFLILDKLDELKQDVKQQKEEKTNEEGKDQNG
jgi:hypothetical protein